jgi:hypothetical protein
MVSTVPVGNVGRVEHRRLAQDSDGPSPLVQLVPISLLPDPLLPQEGNVLLR